MIKSSNCINSLLISDSIGQDKNQIIRETLTALGSLQISPPKKEILIQEKHYDLVIVDAVSVFDPVEIVSQIRNKDSDIKIIVMSASPHWKMAKATIKAGATDYLPKSLTKEQILSALQIIFGKNLVNTISSNVLEE
jgi:DNA-binding NarL/FixJ family response regulator